MAHRAPAGQGPVGGRTVLTTNYGPWPIEEAPIERQDMTVITRRGHGSNGNYRRLSDADLAPLNVESLVYELVGSSLILAEDWERLSPGDRDRLLRQTDRERALSLMVDCGLLTPYQSTRISTGNTFGLVLGNFRVLE